jgi:hypothetical protein
MKHLVITDLSDGEQLKRYLAELKEALPSFPVDLQRYVEECGLHDAYFVEARVDLAEQSLTLEFIGDCMSEDVPHSFARRFRFSYCGVTSFGFRGAKDAGGFPRPTDLEYVDHDRLKRISTEYIEHRIVFHPGAEFVIRFRDFRLWYEDFEFVPAA